MTNNNPVKSSVKRQNEKKDIRRIDNSGLKRSEKWMAAEVQRIPEGKSPGLNAFHPEVTGRDEERRQIALSKEAARPEYI